MGRNGPKSQSSCHRAACVGELVDPAAASLKLLRSNRISMWFCERDVVSVCREHSGHAA